MNFLNIFNGESKTLKIEKDVIDKHYIEYTVYLYKGSDLFDEHVFDEKEALDDFIVKKKKQGYIVQNDQITRS